MTDAKQQELSGRTALTIADDASAPHAPFDTSPLSIAVRSPEFLCNAVALTGAGVMFLGLPRWHGMQDTPSVVRVEADGSLQPFPGGDWNDWKFGPQVADAFVQVNALHIFGDDTLWVVDQGAPDRKATLPGAQKVLQFDTRSGALLRALRFDAGILPEGAQLNDLRIHDSRIFLTDSGRGALIVHDLATGHTLRRLDRHPLLLQSEVQPLRGTGRRVLVDADGERPRVGADFLEISPDGAWLYFSTPTGPFRRLPTGLLCDAAVDDEVLAASIVEVAAIPTLNGSAMDSLGNLYLADAEARRIEVRAPSGQRATLVADERLVDRTRCSSRATGACSCRPRKANTCPSTTPGATRSSGPSWCCRWPCRTASGALRSAMRLRE